MRFSPVMVLASILLSLPATGRASAAPADLETEIRPLLQKYCYRCHDGPRAKHDVNFSQFPDIPSIQRHPKLWRSVLTQLNDRTMPPDDKPQPSDMERTLLIEWIQHTLTNLDPAAFEKNPGRVTLRRLNRFEYNNTVRDLFDVTVKPADAFPADGAGGGGFDNNADTLFIPPILLEQYLAAATEVLKDARDSKLLIVRPETPDVHPGLRRDAAKQILSHYAYRAFRRPVKDAELDRFLKLFDLADARGDDFPTAIRLPLKALLVSPHFLFRVEQDRDSAEPWEVSDYELASRLSYFIWSSMPDDELLKTAEEGKLRDPATLEAHVRRMLKDPKSKAIAESFGTQWLGIRELLTTKQPDVNKFPKYTSALRDSMYDEAILFIDSVFRDDLPLPTLLDANYTFVNDWLAEHYGIRNRVGGFRGEDFRRIQLPDRTRGGILTLGAVLTVTSQPLRTSPVLRGKWVLEQILGSPPPPPPPDVPELPKDDAKTDGLTFRQRLEMHRKNPECASCHNRLDPPGFGLEHFDAVGRFRKELNGEPIDASGILPTGESFNGPAELKQLLLTRKPEFIRNLTEKMLAYALGRGLEYYDHPTIHEITTALANNDFKASTLILEITKSYPFRYRSNAAAERTRK